MDNEEFLNSLRQVNTLLDEQLSRLDSIERNNPKQAVYLQQINNALIKPEESCTPCFVLPSTGTSTGGGGGSSPEIINATYDSLNQTMTVTGRAGLAVATKDPNGNVIGSGVIGSDGSVTYPLNVEGLTNGTVIATNAQGSNVVEHTLVYDEEPWVGVTDFDFQTGTDRYLGRLRTISFGFRHYPEDGITPFFQCAFNFYPLGTYGNMSDMILLYNSGQGVYTQIDGLPVDEATVRSWFQMSFLGGIGRFHYRGVEKGVLAASGDGMQNAFIITSSTPVSPLY